MTTAPSDWDPQQSACREMPVDTASKERGYVPGETLARIPFAIDTTSLMGGWARMDRGRKRGTRGGGAFVENVCRCLPRLG